MIGVIQMKKPTADSSDFYCAFFNMYNMLQVNDVIIYRVFDEAIEALDLSTNDLLENINTDNYARGLIPMFKILGIETPKNVIKMNQEDRGTDTSISAELQLNGISPFDWYRRVNEFIQLYAIFEQAIKEFLLKYGCNFNKESQAIKVLIQTIRMNIFIILKSGFCN